MPRDKKDWYFTGGVTEFDEDEREFLRMDEVGLFSTTNADDAATMSWAIASLPGLSMHDLSRLPVITDGCACCGGNTISFACCGKFEKVNAVELDETRCNEFLNANVLVTKGFRPSMSETNVMCGSYLDLMFKLRQDVVFLDPPWGGPDYNKHTQLSLFLGDRNVADVVVDLFHNRHVSGTRYVVIKTCHNFALDEMREKLRQADPLLGISLLLQTKKYPVYCVSFPMTKAVQQAVFDNPYLVHV